MSYNASSKWNAVIVLALGLVLVGGIVWAANSVIDKRFVPEQFSNARTQAAQTAEGIVTMSGDSISNLAKVSDFDKQGKYDLALDVVLQEVSRNSELRDRAEVLSQQLGLMTQVLAQVKPQDAAQTGVQAIGKEYQIVEKLVDYNGLTYQLLDLLRGRYDGLLDAPAGPAAQAKINQFIAQMNADASAVNTLNEEYKGLMSRFDSLTK